MSELDVTVEQLGRRSSGAGLVADRLSARFGRDALFRRLLAAADVIAVCGAAAVVTVWSDRASSALLLGACMPAWIVVAKIVGLYDRDHRTLRHLTVDELQWIVVWAFGGTAFLTLLLVPFPSFDLRSVDWLRIWVSLIALDFAFRASVRVLWRRMTPPERILLVGGGPLADAVVRKLELFPDIHARIDRRVERSELLYGRSAELDGVDRVVVACRELGEALIEDLLPQCRLRGVKLTVVPPARGMFGTATHLGHIADLPLLAYNTWDISRVTLTIKRGFDVVFAALGLVLALPLLTLASLAIVVDDGLPVFFRQTRAGQGGRPFEMIKFRTMVRGAEAMLSQLVPFEQLDDPMFKLKADPRVTGVGRLLRRISLDEVPQLVNVLRGEMSIVGPRPEQLDLVELYEPEHEFRLSVKPGITGPMQVYGRGELSFAERLSVEREYVENLSLARDLRIVLMTLPAVFGRRGAF
jgi:exopolysaccharide biosynthesis polyprenyl glycosylphosphotransferase